MLNTRVCLTTTLHGTDQKFLIVKQKYLLLEQQNLAEKQPHSMIAKIENNLG